MPIGHARVGVWIAVCCAFALRADAEPRFLEVPGYIKVWAYQPEYEDAGPDGWRERPESNAEIRGDEELLTSPATRAEIRLDFPNWLRVDESSVVSFPILRAHQYFIEIERGTVQYSQYFGSSADIRLRAPHALMVPLQNGRYDVQVNDDGFTRITVRDGTLRIFANGEHRDLIHGRTMLLRYVDGELQYFETEACSGGSWDDWNVARDHEATHLSGYRAIRHDILNAWLKHMHLQGIWTDIVVVLD